jgi:hypothetical protein
VTEAIKVCIRERLLGRPPDLTIEMPADIPCVIVNSGNELACLIEHRGQLYADAIDIAEKDPWRAPVVSLGACRVGDLVFANCSNWANAPKHWTRYEIMSE